MTKEQYFEMCEMMGSEPVEDEIPVEFDDLYSEVGEGLVTRSDVLHAVHPEHKEIREKRTKSFFFFNKKGKEVKEGEAPAAADTKESK